MLLDATCSGFTLELSTFLSRQVAKAFVHVLTPSFPYQLILSTQTCSEQAGPPERAASSVLSSSWGHWELRGSFPPARAVQTSKFSKSLFQGRGVGRLHPSSWMR